MEIPSLNVDRVDYGEPTDRFVVVWSGPIDASGFSSQEEAEKEIEFRKLAQIPNAFQARIFRLNSDQTAWISV